MSVTVPNALALTGIADGSSIVASDHRNNYAAVQVGVNGLIAMFTAAPTKGDLIVAAGGGAFDRLGVGSNGQAIVADSTQALGVKWSTSAGAEIDFTQNTAGLSLTTSEQTFITGSSVTYDGIAKARATIHIPRLLSSGNTPTIRLYRDSTVLAQWGPAIIAAPVTVEFEDIPTAGAHTYAVKALTDSGTATITASTGGTASAGTTTAPAFLRITKAS